jgi:hypothetical protein
MEGTVGLQSIAKALTLSHRERHVADMLHAIHDAAIAKKIKKQRHLSHLYLNSFDAKLAALRCAFLSLKPHRRPTKEQLAIMARKLDAWQGTDEKAIAHYRRKSSDPSHFRIVFDFGIESRALQYLVGCVLAHVFEPNPSQFALRGGYKAAIVAAAKTLMKGPVRAVELDIEDCFPSFDGEKLSGLLPLPKKVTTNVVIAKYLNVTPGNILDFFGPTDGDEGNPFELEACLVDARRGIPQGSAVSSLVAEFALALSLEAIPPVGDVFAYADNVLLLAQTENEAVSMTKALWAALEANPAGRLRPTVKGFDPGQAIEFLGHELIYPKGGVIVRPTVKNLAKFHAARLRLATRAKAKGLLPLERRARAKTYRRYVRGWCAAFSVCKGIEKLRADALNAL